MRTVTKWTRNGDDDGGSDGDDGTPTKRSIVPSFRCGSWLLGGLTVLLMMQHTAVVAHPTSVPVNPNLRETIDIPSEVDTPPEKERFTEIFDPDEDLTLTRTGYDLDFTLDNRTVLKRSEKTMEDYKKFIVNNCRDKFDNLDTFFTWEHDQFASHLKTKISSIPNVEDPVVNAEETEEKKALRALLAPDNDATGTLKSLCKSTMINYDEEERIRNHKLENEIVNSVFANLYRNGGRSGFKIHVIQRKNTVDKEDVEDEDFAKEVNRVLRR